MLETISDVMVFLDMLGITSELIGWFVGALMVIVIILTLLRGR